MSSTGNEYKGVPPPRLSENTVEGALPPWTRLVQSEKYVDHKCRPCSSIFVPGKLVKLEPPGTCSFGRECSFAHSIRQLQAPGGYQKNQPLPADARDELKIFHCADWGSDHCEKPILEIPFESTYPTKVTRFVHQILARDPSCMAEGPCRGEHIWTLLCHSFTFHGKCPYWQNCMFLHVERSCIGHLCRRYKCQVNRKPTCCSFSKCLYAHKIKLLTIPPAMTTPAFEGAEGETIRELTLLAEDGYTFASIFSIKRKYIARTEGCRAYGMCNNPWCTVTPEARCKHVHLLPSAWSENAFQNVTGKRPEVPAYFQNAVSAAAPPSENVPVRNCWRSNSGKSVLDSPQHPNTPPPRNTTPLTEEYPPLVEAVVPPMTRQWGKQPVAVPIPRSDTSHSDTTGSGSLTPQTLTEPDLGMKDPVAMDEPVDRYDSELTDSDLGGSHEVESVSDEAQFLTLLDLPAFQDFKPTRLGTFPEHEALRAKWDGGVSPRFRAHYDAWLQSKQMNTKFLHAGVLTHSKNNSEVGKGFAASVWLGITVADGREVALKVFMPSSANDTEEKQAIENHFNKEMMALKRHGGTPGTVGYLGSFQRAIENEDEGVMEYQNVVILELMEGTLQEAVSNWSRDLIGSFEHLLLVRYVLGSILDILGQLNHGQFQSLVHRDVKPDNIMVDRFKNIRIIDFGISRVVDKYRQCTKVTSSDGTVIYTSPEAQRQFPEAHITSDLYSVGMVAQFLLTGRDPSTFADPRILPLAWPEYHRLAMQHLHRELVKQDPNERALNSIARDTNTPHHRILLSHPFFWTARKSVSFLVALGNFTTPPLPGLSDAVRSCYGKEGWFAGVEEFESSAFPVREGDKESPWSLLRFIRHQYTHATDQGLNGAADNPLLTRPVILEHFPRLVLECWKHLIGYSRFISRKCPTLAIYFRSGWDVQAARDPEEERSWL